MSTLLISNVQIVNEGLIQEADVFINGGRIERIGSDLNHLHAAQIIDGNGKFLIPGMIDAQSKMSQASHLARGIRSESKAAVAGGITSNFLISTIPSASDPTNPSSIQRKAESYCNYSYYFQAQESNLSELSCLDVTQFCGISVDMSSNVNAMRLDAPDLLRQCLEDSSILVAVQAEDAPTIFESEESYRQIYGDEIPFHLHGSIRGSEACFLAARDVLQQAVKAGQNIHLFNVSSVNEIELLSRMRQKSAFISADVSSHYLTFSDVDYAERGGLLKCRPAIKSDIDRAALMQGLLDNDIDSINSGHIPISFESKQGCYFDVPFGLPSAQFALASLLEHFQDQILSLETIVAKTSHNVADRFGVVDRGYIREGYWADLVMLDLDGSFIARDEDVLSEAGWTIFNGNEFRSSVHTTIVNGVVVWSDGVIKSLKGQGEFIDFSH